MKWFKRSKEFAANFNIICSWYVTKFSRDIYLPSLPAIASALHTSNDNVQYTVSAYFFGLALSRFIWTPLSDIYGRRTIILASIPIFIIGSLMAAMSHHILTFFMARMVQALGIGCVTSIGRAILSDLYDIKGTTKALTYLSLFAAWAPALATTLGGIFTHFFSWRVSFIFLAACGYLLFLQSLKILQETNDNRQPAKQVIVQVAKNYVALMKNVTFWRYLLCFSLLFSGTVVYYTASPFLFVDTMHIKPAIYGLFSFITVAGLLTGKFVATGLGKFIKTEGIMLTGILVGLVSGIIMAILAATMKASVINIMGPTCLFFIGAGIMSPTSKAVSMAILPQLAGTGAALFGVAQGLASSGSSIIIGALHERTALPMAITLIGVAILALLTYLFVKPKGGVVFAHE